MVSKKELDENINNAIITYVNENPVCSANAIMSAVIQVYKHLTTHEIASRIRSLGDEISWDGPDDLRVYFPADKTEYESLTQEEITNYVLDCFASNNNYPKSPLDVSLYIRKQLKNTQKKLIYDDLEQVLNEPSIIEKLPISRRFKLKKIVYRNYLENKRKELA
jgi:hypothetical protein